MEQKPFMVHFAQKQKQECAELGEASYDHDSQMTIMSVEAMSRTNTTATLSTGSNGYQYSDDARTD